MSSPIHNDFISDPVCPWRAIAPEELERIPEQDVELDFWPFELNPQLPTEGLNAVVHLMQKYDRCASAV
ncbi:hypothetical protein [Pseudomonas sp. BIC9C]|uniref:hypothetical protein n=1 Tax=Pseudomonas sp. BIC9C TaxID=3078458 RepID=UPI002AD4B35F|nr:hypothetical protein [Pseudomonas sp. BIC9C]